MKTPTDVLELIQNLKLPKTNRQTIDIVHATSRICAQTVTATMSLPRYRTSAMDGYAICSDDICKRYEIIGRILSGEDKSFEIDSSSAVKIMTGAKVPDTATIVVPIECVEVYHNHIEIKKELKTGQNIRTIGEDIAIGDTIVLQNTTINFATIGVLASQGVKNIEVYSKPKVAVFASGEELKDYKDDIKSHQIYNSNSPSLVARCGELGCDVKFVGTARDDMQSIADTIKDSLDVDMLITTGGASVGDADLTERVFESLGMDMLVDGIAIKPGKPTMIGKIGDTVVLNLPGNPFAMQIIFEMFGTVMIQKLKQSSEIYHKLITTKLKDSFTHKSKFMTLVPGYFDGESFAIATKKLPGMVSVLNHNNSFAVLGQNSDKLAKNSDIKIISINHKEFTSRQKDMIN